MALLKIRKIDSYCNFAPDRKIGWGKYDKDKVDFACKKLGLEFKENLWLFSFKDYLEDEGELGSCVYYFSNKSHREKILSQGFGTLPGFVYGGYRYFMDKLKLMWNDEEIERLSIGVLYNGNNFEKFKSDISSIFQ